MSELRMVTSLLSFISVEYNNPADQTLAINNSGTGTLNWTANESIPWLSLSQTFGTAPSTITVVIESSKLAADDYTGEIQITAGDQTKTISVNLKVESNSTPANNQIYLPLITR